MLAVGLLGTQYSLINISEAEAIDDPYEPDANINIFTLLPYTATPSQEWMIINRSKLGMKTYNNRNKHILWTN